MASLFQGHFYDPGFQPFTHCQVKLILCQEFVMDGIDMGTKQFFEKIRRENSQRAESSRVDYRCQVLRDLSVSDSFNRLNADFPASDPALPFCPELHEVKQNVCDDHNNHIYASPAPFWKENDTVELFPKKPAVGPSDYTRVVFPATNGCNQSRQQATENPSPKAEIVRIWHLRP
jgi:hypothetical protein